MCGLAGFGSIQLYLPDQGVHEFIDFHGKAPSTATPDMWKDLITTNMIPSVHWDL
jgi:gamma-glutamyltranspeptidase/glutathione hydrolase